MAKRRKPKGAPVYEFSDSPRTFPNADKADAGTIGRSLAQIAADHGGHLRPDDVVEAARQPKHVLHQHFEWNLQRAAHAHWLDTARRICRSVTIIHDDDSNEPPRRAWVSVSDPPNGKSYRSSDEILGTIDLQLAVMRAALRELQAFEKRYHSLRELCKSVSIARAQLESEVAARQAARERGKPGQSFDDDSSRPSA